MSLVPVPELTLKLSFGTQTKRVHRSNVIAPTVNELRVLCRSVFDLTTTSFDIKYTDDEGDVISVTNDDDVVEAVRISNIQKKTTTSFVLFEHKDANEAVVAVPNHPVISSSSSSISPPKMETALEIATRSIMMFTPVSIIKPLAYAIVDPEHQCKFAALFQANPTKTACYAVQLRQIHVGQFWHCMFSNLFNTVDALERCGATVPRWVLRAYGRQLLHDAFQHLESHAKAQAAICQDDSTYPLFKRGMALKDNQKYIAKDMKLIQDIMEANSDFDIFAKLQILPIVTSNASSI